MSETKDQPLAPCPFCGGKALLGQSSEGGWFVNCVNCRGLDYYGYKEQIGDGEYTYYSKEEWIEAWNTRSMSEERVEKIALDLFAKKTGEDFKQINNEVNKHGLLNPERWDNPEAGFFDIRDFCKELAAAIAKGE